MVNIYSRIFHGVLANGANQFVLILIQIITVPIFIKYWGVSLYGEWIVLYTVNIYLLMTDVGFISVASNKMTMLVSQANKSEALKTFQSTWLLVTASSVVIYVIILTMFWQFPFEKWFQFTSLNHVDGYYVIALLSLHAFVVLQTKLILVGYRCSGYYALGTYFSSIILFIEFAALSIAIMCGATPFNVAFVLLMVRILGTIGIRLRLRFYDNGAWIIYGKKYAKKSEIKQLLKPSIYFMALPAGSIIKDQGIIIAISIILSPAFVVIYSTTKTLINSGYKLSSMLMQAIWPEISMAFGANKIELVSKLYKHVCRLVFWLVIVSVLILIFLGESIINLWTLGAVEYIPLFFNLLLFTLVTNTLWNLGSLIPIAINRHHRVAAVYLLASLVTLGLAILLMKYYSLAGVAFAIFFIEIMLVSYVLNVVVKILEVDLTSFLEYIVKPPTFLDIKKYINLLCSKM